MTAKIRENEKIISKDYGGEDGAKSLTIVVTCQTRSSIQLALHNRVRVEIDCLAASQRFR